MAREKARSGGVEKQSKGLDLIALLLGRCPRCRRGRIFRDGFWGLLGLTHDACPDCGLRFLREAGYFLGAMYVSYGLGVLTVLPLAMLLVLAFDWSLPAVLGLMLLQTLVSMPLFLRYSRAIWLHVDQAIDPR